MDPLQTFFSDRMQFFAQNVYQPVLMKTLEYRWVTWAVATAVLIMALALVISGRVIFSFRSGRRSGIRNPLNAGRH